MSLPVDADVVAYQEGVRLFKEGKILEAIGKFRYAATHGQNRPMEHFALASALAKLGHLEEAAQEYRQFLTMSDGHSQQEEAALKALAQIKEMLGPAMPEPPEQVAPPLQGPPEAEPLAPPAPAAALPESAPVDEAKIETARRALESSQAERRQRVERVRKLYEEAVAFYRACGYDAAMSRLAILAEEWGRTGEVVGLMGLCRMGQSQYDDAVALLTEARDLNPSAGEPVLNLARAEYERGCARAAALLERLVVDNPTTPGAWYNLGIVREARSDIEGAIEAFQKATLVDPEDRQALASLTFAKRRIQ